MKVSFGIITRNFDTLDPIEQFLDNAKKYKHDIYSVIIAYSHLLDYKLLETLNKRVKVFPIKINNTEFTSRQFSRMKISHTSTRTLLHSPIFQSADRVPYGFNRNCAVIKAIMTGSDILIFIDTDVYPNVLIKEEGKIYQREIDFVGNHLEYLKREDVIATTSDYSGYYIIPPMNFRGMQELLIGLQKEEAYNYVLESDRHNCLNVQDNKKRNPFITNKLLGGNMAIKLDAFEKIPPFFSSAYKVGDEIVLTRGEDTLFGLAFQNSQKKCIDIDTHIFHDTYNDYPSIPDIIYDRAIQERFFYACVGWIGRNPFLNWKSGKDLKECKAVQLRNLKIGSKALAKYTENDRFLCLTQALENSYNRIEQTIDEYHNTLNAWEEFIEKVKQRGETAYADTDY